MKHTSLILALILVSLNLSAQSEQTQDEESYIFESEHLGNKYLKINKVNDSLNDDWAQTYIEVYDGSTDSLLQTLDSVYMMRHINEIEVYDYNFDGLYEFSILDQVYAGSSSRVYYLYDPETDRFFESGFSGNSLEFDNVEKRIYERNQCCAGSSITETTYTIKDNEMVLIEQHCYELDMESAESEFGLDYYEVDCN